MNLSKNFNALIIISVFLISVASVIFLIEFRKDDPILQEAENYRAKKVPNVLLTNLETNMDYSHEVMNQDVFLVYLITGCDACRKELQFLSQIVRNSDSKAKVFGIMSGDKKNIKNYVKENGVEIPILIDTDGRLLRELNIKYFPANFKVSNGEIKKAVLGLPEAKESLLELINF